MPIHFTSMLAEDWDVWDMHDYVTEKKPNCVINQYNSNWPVSITWNTVIFIIEIKPSQPLTVQTHCLWRLCLSD